MAPHSSTLAWKIPWMEEPGRLQSMGSLRVGHDWATLLSFFTFMHWRRTWQPTPVFLPGESWERGCCLWVAQNQIRLKRRSSSSSIQFSQYHLLKVCSFPMVLALLLKNQLTRCAWVYLKVKVKSLSCVRLFVFIWGFSKLFLWSICLSLCQYHTV